MQASVVTAVELNQLLAATPLLKSHHFEVTDVASNECTLAVPFAPELERPGGIISGMTLMGAADVAMWLAIMTVRGTHEQWVTSDMKTAFLRAGRRESFSCSARILKLGRRTAYGVAECVGADSGLLAHHTLSYARVEPK